MERAIGNLLRRKPLWERALDRIRLLFAASGPISTERQLAHEVGKSLWNLVRALMYPRVPGVWSETVSVPSLDFALHDARKSIWAMREYRQFQTLHREDWRRSRKLKRALIHRCRFVSRRFERALFLDREWRTERIQKLVSAIDELDGGTWANRVATSRFLLQEAEDLMLKPSLEHAMTLLLYVYVSTDDTLRVGEQGGDPYSDVERCFRSVARVPGYDRRWEAVYGARRFLIQGLRATERFRVRAEVLDAAARDERELSRSFREARRPLRRAIHFCNVLEDEYRSGCAKHLAHLARFRLWLAAVATRSWGDARSAWSSLIELDGGFVEDVLPRIREFADYAADFVIQGEIPVAVVAQVEQCLRTAIGVTDETDAPPVASAGGGLGIETVEELLHRIEEAKATESRRRRQRSELAVHDKEHFETAARALDVIRAYTGICLGRDGRAVPPSAAAPLPAIEGRAGDASQESMKRSNQRRRDIAAVLCKAPAEQQEELRRVLRVLPSLAYVDFADLGPRGEVVVEQVLLKQIRAEGVDMSPERLRRALQTIRLARRTDVEEGGPSLTDCAEGLRESAAALHDGGTLDLRERAAAHLVNVVRSMTKRLVKKHYGEGIRDVRHDQLMELLVPCSRSDAAPEDLGRDLAPLIEALERYGGSREESLRIQRMAGRAVANLVHEDHPLAALAEINLALPGKEDATSADFNRTMQLVADRCARWCDATGRSRGLQSYGSHGYAFPGPARIASYALNNSLTLLLHRIVTGEIAEEAEFWFPTVRRNIERMRRLDPEFELIPLAHALHLAVEGMVGGNRRSLLEFVARLGEARAANLMAEALDEEDSDELVDLLCRAVEEVYGPQAITMVTAAN